MTVRAPLFPPTEKPRVLVEHPDFYVVHKPALWLTHPVRARVDVPDVLSYMRAETGEPDLAPPHRLDRETSGTQLLSRDPDAARRFFTLFKTHLVGKTYLAVVHGSPDWERYTLDAPLGDLGLGGANRVIIRQAVVPDGRPAVTDFRVVEQRGGFTLIEAYPRSGRLHQIRAHLSHLGLPLVGDKIYGPDPQAFLDFMHHGQTLELTERLLLPRQALHAARIAFPWAGAQFAAEAPLAPDLRMFWEDLAPTE
ncbi:pseudouridine synthase [Deinococcus geothermalis DSM 11300]|uniref:Pseudouridine synthase n=1 Tax=Deinococcus geothermalis (strain DSM 11300 / CIP 105573 / AG-3a) TaxID=319795 RepID=Q1IZY6_DEIGD|nr:RNA pseudouridine synthase [Deinococcus geothermalis]ABF45198.1 pseudouridine synthase [Deinococcus geothermalis DSM 11300]MBI0444480.1 RNA pseudouridine synthase [Deinococcus sp. DB0503]